MVPVAGWIDHSTAVDLVAPEIVSVVVGVTLCGADEDYLSWDLAVDAEPLRRTLQKTVLGIRDVP